MKVVTWKIKLEIFLSIVSSRPFNLNQRLETSMLQNVSIHRDMDILMSNSIDWHKLTNYNDSGMPLENNTKLFLNVPNFFKYFFVEHKI